eukprot:TRINITY_DN20235_c0_g1_i2.p1 TRINITY_DN20235_c0_g1~~TRINITY_DN20235_c0_g1_i2.p1  ORF type:complete len:440 (+),score=142.66 TRINITY_DN20235_c0_g1_i2:972-2291(+)
MVLGLEFEEFVERSIQTVLEAPKHSTNSVFITLDMLRVVRDLDPRFTAALSLPCEHEEDEHNPAKQKLLGLWDGLKDVLLCKTIKRLCKGDRKLANFNHMNRAPPENGGLHYVLPIGMMLIRELSLGNTEMLLWAIAEFNRLKQPAEPVSYGLVAQHYVMGSLINAERAARKHFDSTKVKALFLMNNYQYMWESLNTYAQVLQSHSPELAEQLAPHLVTLNARLIPRTVQYAKVFKWEAFGDLLDAIWLPCNTVLGEEDTLMCAQRFQKFENAFEIAMDSDKSNPERLEALVIPNLALRNTMTRCLLDEVLGGYQVFYHRYQDADYGDFATLVALKKIKQRPEIFPPEDVEQVFTERASFDQLMATSTGDSGGLFSVVVGGVDSLGSAVTAGLTESLHTLKNRATDLQRSSFAFISSSPNLYGSDSDDDHQMEVEIEGA